MPISHLSSHVVRRIASAVARAVDLDAACRVISDEMQRVFGTRTLVIDLHDAGGTAVAGAMTGSEAREWDARLRPLSGGDAVVRVVDQIHVPATVVFVNGSDDQLIAVVIDGDWMQEEEGLRTLALVLSFAVRSVREREDQRRTERFWRGGYAMVRRLSRLGSLESVAQQIVDHVAQLLSAERVSLSLYSQAEDSLAVVATHGDPQQQQIKEVRIRPGAWVIGHVYSAARPVFVRDTRLVPGMVSNPGRYKTFAFAAVPLLAGQETIGVLTVTDKRDGSSFTRQDEMVLRGVSVTAAVLLMAARSDGEAARLAHAATTDSVTGLLNRPYLDARLHQEVERAKREGRQLAVLMADIDDFKGINDSLGHQVGDAVLRAVGGVVRSAVRVFDVCARYGGDEFAILMPNCDHQSAVACAERIRVRVAEGAYDGGVPLPALSMSLGVAVLAPGESAADLLLRADRCLYQAKADGKNAVRAHPQGSLVADVVQPAADVLEEMWPVGGVTTDAIGDEQTARGQALDFVLVVDANQERAAMCVTAVKPFKLGVLVARNGQQAAAVIERFGPPILLIVDLASPTMDGFAVIDAALHDNARHLDIIAWSPSRDLREYAASRLNGHNARVLSGSASLQTMRAAIERVLGGSSGDQPAARPGTSSMTPEQLHAIMTGVSERVSRAAPHAGVAIYLRAPGETQFRALFSWTSDAFMPPSPYYLPRVFNRLQETGAAVVLRDLSLAPFGPPPPGVDDALRGLAAIPITDAKQIVGAICVFDVKPLTTSDADLETLATIAREVFPGATPASEAGGDPIDVAAAPVASRDLADLVVTHSEDQARRLAACNGVTPVLERAGGEFAVARELARARREGRQLSVVLFDVAPAPAHESTTAQSDRLDVVSNALMRAIRQSDLPIRWSVSELLLVLPGLGAVEARSVAERVRAALFAGANHRLAISGGVAELEADERFNTVVDRARKKVAMAVGRGHNRVM